MSHRTDRALELLAELSDGRSVEPASRLSDLGIDSLAFAEIALALESELGIALDEADLDGSSRVRDVLTAVERQMRGGGGCRPASADCRMSPTSSGAGHCVGGSGCGRRVRPTFRVRAR